MIEAHKVPSPFVRYRCSQCHRWVREDALSCRCGAIFYHTIRDNLRNADWGEIQLVTGDKRSGMSSLELRA